jgi:hypothetical protein
MGITDVFHRQNGKENVVRHTKRANDDILPHYPSICGEEMDIPISLLRHGGYYVY